MDNIFDRLTKKKAELDKHRPLPPELVNNLEEWLDVELTYTSNAIEGNTLSRLETALVIEKGITVEGKSLREHLEAINHKKALEFIRELVKKEELLSEEELLSIHGLILKGINDDWAGRYRQIAVRITGSTVILPNYLKVPSLMLNFMNWLRSIKGEHPVKIASDAHYKLVSIHPWVDGNGRTARLLMDLILIRHGYPPALIRKEERKRYIDSLEEAHLGGSLRKFYDLMIEAEERTLEIYLSAATGKRPLDGLQPKKLLKIGELAKKANVSLPGIRHYLDKGLLSPQEHSPGGFMLFDEKTIQRIREIKKLQKEKRLTLAEIKNRLG